MSVLCPSILQTNHVNDDNVMFKRWLEAVKHPQGRQALAEMFINSVTWRLLNIHREGKHWQKCLLTQLPGGMIPGGRPGGAPGGPPGGGPGGPAILGGGSSAGSS